MNHWLNLSDVQLSTELLLASEAMMFGAGLFETLYATDEGIEFLMEHLKRMTQGAEVLNIPLPSILRDTCKLETQLLQGFRKTAFKEGSIRIELTQSGNQSICWAVFRPLNYHKQQYQNGFRLKTIDSQIVGADQLSPFKLSNYLRHFQPRQALKNTSADEYLWISPLGRIMEGTVSNIFIIKDGDFFTPPLSEGILPGVMRQALIASLLKSGVKVKEQSITLADVEASSEVFLTNSLMAVMPVSTIGRKRIQVNRQLTQELLSLLDIKRNIF